jgi:hypothetical protein
VTVRVGQSWAEAQATPASKTAPLRTTCRMTVRMAISPVVIEIERQARDRQCLQAAVRATDQRSDSRESGRLARGRRTGLDSW